MTSDPHATIGTTTGIAADLSRQVFGGSAVAVEAIPESHSGFAYRVRVDHGPRCVLRLPPPGVRPVGAADVLRQARIMGALAAVGLPVPRVLADGGDGTLIDGRPFVLMEELPGVRIEEAARTVAGGPLVAAAFAAMRAFHAVPMERAGIGLEPPVDPHDEVRRWQRVAERAADFLPEGLRAVEGRLLGARVRPGTPTLVHGDYHLGNLLFDGAHVVGVLDWEVAQIGQRQWDIASLCLVGVRRAFPGPNPGGEVGLTLDEILDLLGEPPPDLRWYLAATCYKYAAILAYNLRLHRTGKRHDPVYDEMPPTIGGLVDVAWDYLA